MPVHKKLCRDNDESGPCFVCEFPIETGDHYILLITRDKHAHRLCEMCAREICNICEPQICTTPYCQARTRGA